MSHEEARPTAVKGFQLECPVCGCDKFWHRTTLLNTRAATFFGFDWANRDADNYVCDECGYMFWFHRD